MALRGRQKQKALRHLVKANTLSVGEKYGVLTVAGAPFAAYAAEEPQRHKRHYVVVSCKCGTRDVLTISHLRKLEFSRKCGHR